MNNTTADSEQICSCADELMIGDQFIRTMMLSLPCLKRREKNEEFKQQQFKRFIIDLFRYFYSMMKH